MYSCTRQRVIIEKEKVVTVSGSKGMGNLISDLAIENNQAETEKIIIKTDSKTRIKLEAQKDIIPDDAIIDVIEIASGETFNKIKGTLVEFKNFKAFDITLKSNNAYIQPTGKVKVSVPIPAGFDSSKLVVYRLDENNTKTEYQVTVVNGYATFETDHFSTYVLGETAELSNETQNKTDENVIVTNTEKNDTKLPQTGEETNVFAKWLSIAIALGVFWIFSMLLIEREKKKIIKK